MALEELTERPLRAPARGDLEVLLDHEGRQERPRGLVILVGRPDDSDLGAGHGYDLPGIGRVGHDLLVAGETRIEAHLPDGNGTGAESRAAIDGAIGQRQGGGLPDRKQAHGASTPRSTW